MRFRKAIQFIFFIVICWYAASPIIAANIQLYWVKAGKTTVKRGEVFETQIAANKETPDIVSNLLINGEEYFGNNGGGACRSDGDMFLGWLQGDNPVVRILCTVPKDASAGAKIELIAYQFRNCDNGEEKCSLIKGDKEILIASGEASPSADTSEDIANRVRTERSKLADIVQSIFGTAPKGSGSSSGNNNSGTGGSNEPVPADVQKLSSCIAAKMGDNQDKYEKHLPYILNQVKKQSLSLTQSAYVLATAKHETGNFIYLSELGDDEYLSQYETGQRREWLCNYVKGDGPKFKGRGYVQLTGRCNYAKFTPMDLRLQDPAIQQASQLKTKYESLKDYSSIMSKKVSLLTEPEYIIEDLSGAAAVIVLGHKEGIFTGARLSTYVDGSKKNYAGARAVINDSDKSAQIAGYAEMFEGYLKSCGT